MCLGKENVRVNFEEDIIFERRIHFIVWLDVHMTTSPLFIDSKGEFYTIY